MVVILASKYDGSAVRTMEYLRARKCKFFHINEEDTISIDKLDSNSGEFLVAINNQEEVNLINCTIWNRSSNILSEGILNSILHMDVANEYQRFYVAEVEVVSSYIFKNLPQQRLFGRQVSPSVNKLIVLEEARKIGFNIPSFKVVGSYRGLNQNTQYITKSLSEILWQEDDDNDMINYCSEVNQSVLSNGDFFPSLIQERIDKIGDIRLFVFSDLNYACLIYSDSDEIDIRKAYGTKGIRYLPYSMDSSLLEKVKVLMDRLSLDSGSIDFLLDKSGSLWFLEVNPEGQYGFMEAHCNYNISEQIANKLIENEYKFKNHKTATLS